MQKTADNGAIAAADSLTKALSRLENRCGSVEGRCTTVEGLLTWQ
jgi:hypothetical protein